MNSNSRERILDAGLAILRDDGVVTLDSTAQKVGMSKAGVVHHFPTKEALMNALLDQVADRWENEIDQNLSVESGIEGSSRERILAYLDCALDPRHDASDLVMFASPELRRQLVARWAKRSDSWLDAPEPAETPGQDDSPGQDGSVDPDGFLTVRLIAEGAWLSRAAGINPLNPQEAARIREICLELLDRR